MFRKIHSDWAKKAQDHLVAKGEAGATDAQTKYRTGEPKVASQEGESVYDPQQKNLEGKPAFDSVGKKFYGSKPALRQGALEMSKE